MKRPNMRRKYAVGAVATAIAAGAIAAPVFASTSGSSTSTQANNQASHHGWRGAGFIGDPSQYDATVAAKLGITTAKFEAADQAVRGSMTPPTPGATGATGATNRAAHRTAFETALAAKLGVTTAQLTTAEDAADQTLILKNLSGLVSNGVITQAQATALTTAAGNGTFDSVLRRIEIANLTTHLQKAVTDGHLTQAQANQILADAKAAPVTGGPGFGFGFGGPGGPGGPHGPGDRGRWGGRGPMGAPPNTSSSGSNSLLTPAA
jgi:hypothetical protein